MRQRYSILFRALSMAAACSGVSCSAGDASRVPEVASDAVGTVGLALTPVAGVTLNTFSYTIVGPGSFTRSGTVDVTHSTTLSTVVGGLPVGNGYTVTISATSTDAATLCGGSAAFGVSAGTTSQVSVHLQCRQGDKTGSVFINGVLNACPSIDGIDASPAEALVGSPIALFGRASDADHAPDSIAYRWTASSGNLSNGTTATPTFTCTAGGPVTLTLTASDGDCSESLTTSVGCTVPADAVTVVAASVETTPVPDSGDAADDPAVWVHPSDPSLSVVIGTDKQGGGLGVYGLDGNQIQFLPSGKLNNVDLRDGFPLAGTSVPLVTAGNRTDNSIGIFAFDPATRQLRDVAARKITTLVTYGSCMYKSPVSGKYYYFVDAKDGNIQQWELFATAAGTVDATKVRDLHQLGSQPEACAVDDEGKALFVGEEAKGVWRFDAEPSVTSGPGYEGVLIASTDPGGHLLRDVEGVAIAKTSATGGYIFVSNQGVSTYSVFTREAPYSYVKTFRVERGAACVDPVTGSDGIEVNTANLGPAFPHGVFVTQDDSNDGLNQNFKLVPLQQILGSAPTVDESACSNGGSGGSGGASGAGGNSGSGGAKRAGYGEPFCSTYCNKCASCYATGTFSEGDCVFHQAKTAFTLEDCQAGCAVSATPGAAAKAALMPGFESLSCSDFDGAI